MLFCGADPYLVPGLFYVDHRLWLLHIRVCYMRRLSAIKVLLELELLLWHTWPEEIVLLYILNLSQENPHFFIIFKMHHFNSLTRRYIKILHLLFHTKCLQILLVMNISFNFNN